MSPNTALHECVLSMPIEVIHPILFVTFLLVWAAMGQVTARTDRL